MSIPLERESTIVLAAKFTYLSTYGQIKLEFDPKPQLCSTNMLRMLRDRCEELLAERAIPKPEHLDIDALMEHQNRLIESANATLIRLLAEGA